MPHRVIILPARDIDQLAKFHVPSMKISLKFLFRGYKIPNKIGYCHCHCLKVNVEILK